MASFKGSPPCGKALIVEPMSAAGSTGAVGVAVAGRTGGWARTGDAGKLATSVAATATTAVALRRLGMAFVPHAFVPDPVDLSFPHDFVDFMGLLCPFGKAFI